MAHIAFIIEHRNQGARTVSVITATHDGETLSVRAGGYLVQHLRGIFGLQSDAIKVISYPIKAAQMKDEWASARDDYPHEQEGMLRAHFYASCP